MTICASSLQTVQSQSEKRKIRRIGWTDAQRAFLFTSYQESGSYKAAAAAFERRFGFKINTSTVGNMIARRGLTQGARGRHVEPSQTMLDRDDPGYDGETLRLNSKTRAATDRLGAAIERALGRGC